VLGVLVLVGVSLGTLLVLGASLILGIALGNELGSVVGIELER
jgi:hypothetical protein